MALSARAIALVGITSVLSPALIAVEGLGDAQAASVVVAPVPTPTPAVIATPTPGGGGGLGQYLDAQHRRWRERPYDPAELQQSPTQWPERQWPDSLHAQQKPVNDGSLLWELVGENELGERQKQDRVSALFDLVDESEEKRVALRKVAALPQTFTLAEVRAIIAEALVAQEARLAREAHLALVRAQAALAPNANLTRTVVWGGLAAIVLGLAANPLFYAAYAVAAVVAAESDDPGQWDGRFGPPRVSPARLRAPSAETRLLATLFGIAMPPRT